MDSLTLWGTDMCMAMGGRRFTVDPNNNKIKDQRVGGKRQAAMLRVLTLKAKITAEELDTKCKDTLLAPMLEDKRS